MPDHAVFIRVGDRSSLQLLHLLAGPVGNERHAGEIVIGKIHAADIHRDPEIVVAEEILLEPAPE